MQDEVEADIRAIDGGFTVRPSNSKYARTHAAIIKEKLCYAAVPATADRRGRYLDFMALKLKNHS